MKSKKIILIALASILSISCSSTQFYQVYKTAYSDKISLKEDDLVYEDENCKLIYNLWSEGGDIGFKFYNKTDKNIYLNLEECFFVSNGIAYNYYKNRVFTSSSTNGSTVLYGVNASKSNTGYNYLNLIQTNTVSFSKSSGIISSKGYSESITEEKVICIPSKTAKIISEYTINNSLIRNCDLLKFPKKNQVKTIAFTQTKSPIVFSNRIVYSVGDNLNPVKFENEFYVSEITNYPETELVELKYEEYCGQKAMYLQNYFKNVSADKFYIKYTQGQYYEMRH